MFVDKKGMHTTPTFGLEGKTLVFDRKRNMRVMEIDGVVALPIGAEIELTHPNANAHVTGVRLLAGSSETPTTVCLDVEVPAKWWDEEG